MAAETIVALAASDLAAVREAAEAAYPDECCGLLVGRRAPGRVTVTRVAASANLAAEPARRFEIDPRLWLALAHRPEPGGAEVVGLYHSHPDHPAEPSPRDLADAWGEGTVWLIVGVADGRAAATGCFVFREDGGARFEPARLAAPGEASGEDA